MRRIIATVGATLAVLAAIATSATPASACQGPGWYNCNPPKSGSPLLPYVEQEQLYRLQ